MSRPTYATDRQREVLAHIAAYRAKHGFAPSIRGLCELLGVESTNTVAGFIRSLQAKGLVTRTSRIARSLLVTPAGLRELGAGEGAR